MSAATHKYGCHSRQPFVPAYKATNGRQWIPTFGQQDCQFTKTTLGQADKGCAGCLHKANEGAA